MLLLSFSARRLDTLEQRLGNQGSNPELCQESKLHLKLFKAIQYGKGGRTEAWVLTAPDASLPRQDQANRNHWEQVMKIQQEIRQDLEKCKGQVAEERNQRQRMVTALQVTAFLVSTGLGSKVGPRLRECCRQSQAEVVSNCGNKHHQTRGAPLGRAL